MDNNMINTIVDTTTHFTKLNIAITLAIIVIIIMIYVYFTYYGHTKDEFFYTVNEINPILKTIEKIKISVYNECTNVYTDRTLWKDWPESSLYSSGGNTTWKIFPFYAFGVWATDNCKLCPTTTRYLKTIKGLKLATLSKLSPRMKLSPHAGWASHSNDIIRCHYGLIVPKGCYISVSSKDNPPMFDSDDKINNYPHDIKYNEDNNIVEHIKFQKQFEWLVFDDAKMHYAENMSDNDRIVLIIDVKRPKTIKQGSSTVKTSHELNEIVNWYKRTQYHDMS
jgi:hypothetical protein